MRETFFAPIIASLLLVTFAATASAADKEASSPDYAKQIAPLLQKYCAGCHNDDDREGDLSLESYASLMKGTPKGPAVLAGDAEGSRILRVLTGAADPAMPPDGEAKPTDEELALLTS